MTQKLALYKDEMDIKLRIRIQGLIIAYNSGIIMNNGDPSIADFVTINEYFRFDRDNNIDILINGESLFNGPIGQLGLESSELIGVSALMSREEKKVLEYIDFLSKEARKEFEFGYDKSNVDYEKLYLSKKSGLLVVEELADFEYLDAAPLYENRWMLIRYGKFHLTTDEYALTNFSLEDLFFKRDSNLEDIDNSDDWYSFSRVIHRQLGEIKFIIDSFTPRSEELVKGWIWDA